MVILDPIFFLKLKIGPIFLRHFPYLCSAEGGPTIIQTNLVGLLTSQWDRNTWGLWSLTNKVIGYGAKDAVVAKIRQDSAPLGSFLANGFSIPKKQNKVINYKANDYIFSTLYLLTKFYVIVMQRNR